MGGSWQCLLCLAKAVQRPFPPFPGPAFFSPASVAALLGVAFGMWLGDRQVTSAVKHICVNSEVGTIAVCLDFADTHGDQIVSRQNVFIVWPAGQLQDEEPSDTVSIHGRSGVDLCKTRSSTGCVWDRCRVDLWVWITC